MNKGFTLAELLGVIVVISLLLLLIIPAIINGVSSREDDVELIQNEIIFEAVSQYLDLDKETYSNVSGNIYCVSIGDLLETGLLANPVKNVVEDKEFDSQDTISVKITNEGVREYSFDSECVPRSPKDIIIEVKPSNSQWSQSKIVKVVYPDFEGTNQYDNGNGWQSVSNDTFELTYNKDGVIKAQTIDVNGNVLVQNTKKVEKIDTALPSVIKLSKRGWNNNAQQQVDITMTDTKSGVEAYYIGKTDKAPSTTSDKWIKFELSPYGGIGTVSEFLSLGKHYLFVIDRAGNILQYVGEGTDENGAISIEDNTPPTCELKPSGTFGTNQWYTSDVKITLNKNDTESGIDSYGLVSSGNPTYNKKDTITHKENTAGITYYGYVRDKAGNTSDCSLFIKRDADGPVYQSGGNVTTGKVTEAKFTDSPSGISNIQYLFSTSSSTPNANNSGWSSSKTGTTACGNKITVFAKATDNAGNYTIRNLGQYNTGSCVSASVVNNDVLICPDNQEKVSWSTCTKLYNNYIKVSGVWASGTTVGFNIKLHMNDYAVSYQVNAKLNLCVAKAGTSSCFYKIASWTQKYNWAPVGKVFYNENITLNISSWPAGEYKIITTGGSRGKFVFTKNQQISIFRVNR